MISKAKKIDKILNPKSLAIIGASSKSKTVGWGLMKNALLGKAKRKIFAVNPFQKEVLGVRTVPSIKQIKEPVDLAVIAVPAKIVPKIIEECSQKKVKGIIIISSGFAEEGKQGKILEQKIKKIAKLSDISIIGPNCLGIIRPGIKLNASFAPFTPKKGSISFISQSGALIDSIIDRNLIENYGFSNLISCGNQADLCVSDFLEWEEKNLETKVIAVYLEGLKNGRKFMETAKRVAKIKPIIAIKAGKTDKGKKAVSSHTGSLAGDYQIYKAVFKQTGIIEAQTLEELFDTAKALAWQPRCKNGIGIVTNGGGCGVLLTDYCEELGINLTNLSKKTINKLEKSGKMHPAFSKRNPLDIIGDALSARYKVSIEALLEQKNIQGLLIVQTLQIMTAPVENAKIIVELKNKFPKKPIICCFLGGKITKSGIDFLEKNKVPNYSDLRKAAIAMKALIV